MDKRTRREFVRLVGASAAVSLSARDTARAQDVSKEPAGEPEPMPMVPFGRHTVSRLIVGANPINGGSHLSRFVNNQMKQYFTDENKRSFLSHCEDVGINTWQAGPQNIDFYKKYSGGGGKLQYISLAKDLHQVDRVVSGGAIAVAHHGEVTDRLFKSGRVDSVKDFLTMARDKGVMAGVSTHMPAVVDYIESEGWEPDFYMTCVYERHRTAEELKKLLGYIPIPVREVYLKEDPARMFKKVQQTDKTCLAFKILAAGRLCDKQSSVENAFRTTFEQIKPTDAVIVGMYPKYEDQALINATHTRHFGNKKPTPAGV